MIDVAKAKIHGLIVECYAPLDGPTIGQSCATTCAAGHVHQVTRVLDGDLLTDTDGLTPALADALEDAFETAIDETFPEHEPSHVNRVYREVLVAHGYEYVLEPRHS